MKMQSNDQAIRPIRRWTALAAVAALLTVGALPMFADDDTAVAEVNGETITLSELEAAVAPQLVQLDEQRRELLETALPQLIDRKVIEAEATKREISPNELLAAELESKVAPVTNADIDAWYAANQARVRAPKEQVTEQIRGMLVQERSAPVRGALISSLRKEHKVKVFMEPVRKEVASETAPAMGPAEAPIQIVEFSDFQCPYCARLIPEMDKVVETYGDQVQVMFRQFPLNSIHAEAQKAAEGSLCAGDQGKFWEFHDALFENQRELGIDKMKEHAAALELDVEAFGQCLDTGAKSAAVTADLNEGLAIGVNSTPSIFVNGRKVKILQGQTASQAVSALIEDELIRVNAD